MDQVADAVVDRRRGHQEHAGPERQLREGAIPPGGRIAEVMSFVDDQQSSRAPGPAATQGLVREDRRRDLEPLAQALPLTHQHRRHHEREGLFPHERHGRRDVGLAEPRRVRQHRAPEALHDRG